MMSQSYYTGENPEPNVRDITSELLSLFPGQFLNITLENFLFYFNNDLKSIYCLFSKNKITPIIDEEAGFLKDEEAGSLKDEEAGFLKDEEVGSLKEQDNPEIFHEILVVNDKSKLFSFLHKITN